MGRGLSLHRIIKRDNAGMEILYEDNSIIVTVKPAGVPVQSKEVSVRSLEHELKSYRRKKGEPAEIYVVHRLDQPVSGILVFGKTKKAAAALSKEIAKEDFLKKYHALVYKESKATSFGSLKDFLSKDAKANKAIIVTPGTPGAKEAFLDYNLIADYDRSALYEITLHTGRFHQIRAQLSNFGFPIVGDLKYGSPESIQYSKDEGIKNICLCACDLTFRHPLSGKYLNFTIEDGYGK